MGGGQWKQAAAVLRCCAGLLVLLGACHPAGALTGGWDDPAAEEEGRAGLFSSRELTPQRAGELLHRLRDVAVDLAQMPMKKSNFLFCVPSTSSCA